jgi:hypothetical protein
VNTGETVVGGSVGGQDLALGDATNVAARLEQVASPGEVLLGDATYRLVRDAVTAEPLAPLELKGRGVAVDAWRLVAVKPGAAGHARLMDAPMVGRARELRLLREAFDRAVGGHTARLVTLLGAAGVGKSRMLQELLAGVGEGTTVLRGRCLDYGQGTTYLPLAEIIRQAAGAAATDEPADVRRKVSEVLADGDDVPAVLAAILGDPGAGVDAEAVQDAVYRLFAALARRAPLVVVIDDLQWAEEAVLDLIERIADRLRDVPVLLCCLARPELREKRPSWGGGRVNATLMLEPLSPQECGVLVDNLLDNLGGADDARNRMIEAAGGNPLYLEELVRMLVEDGLIVRGTSRWVTTGHQARLDAPPSIAALLAARLDNLPAGERTVLELASVVGTVFSRAAVVALCAPTARVTGHLLNLVRKDLIRPDTTTLLGESALHFRHPLLRDAAYRSLSKRERAELHERCAAWLVEALGGRVTELEEVVGYHLEQACRYRTGLGPADAPTLELARRAAEHLAASGRRAFRRRDMTGAVGLLGRGAGLLPADSPQRLAILPDLAAALVEMGTFDRAEQLLSEAVAGAERHTDPKLRASALRVRSVLQLLVHPGSAMTEAITTDAVTAGVVADWTLLRDVGQMSNPESVTIGAFAMTTVLGSMPVGTGVERYAGYLRDPPANRTLAVRMLAALAGLTAMEGRFDDARGHLAQARNIVEQLGLRVRAVALSYVSGLVNLLAGDPTRAEADLIRGCEDCRRMGERYVLGNLLALLAQVVHAQGRFAEAMRYADEADAAGAPGDVVTHVTAAGARAKALAGLGRGAEAESIARAAVTTADGTDLLNVSADALRDLAEVLATAGRLDPAAEAATGALERYLRKGNTVSAQRTRQLLTRLRAHRAVTGAE